jgi:hypothetical protein
VASTEPAFPDLRSFHRGHPGLTDAIGTYYAEAARVCLSRHHMPPVSIRVEADDAPEQTYHLDWTPASREQFHAWANRDDATRDGAYCLVLAAAQTHLGLAAIGRAEARTGADYYLAPVGSSAAGADGELDFEAAVRLEVSGMDSASEAQLRRRVTQKAEQARRGQSNLPAMAGVVAFSLPRVVFRRA